MVVSISEIVKKRKQRMKKLKEAEEEKTEETKEEKPEEVETTEEEIPAMVKAVKTKPKEEKPKTEVEEVPLSIEERAEAMAKTIVETREQEFEPLLKLVKLVEAPKREITVRTSRRKPFAPAVVSSELIKSAVKYQVKHNATKLKGQCIVIDADTIKKAIMRKYESAGQTPPKDIKVKISGISSSGYIRGLRKALGKFGITLSAKTKQNQFLVCFPPESTAIEKPKEFITSFDEVLEEELKKALKKEVERRIKPK